MTWVKRAVSPTFWRRAIAVHGLDGVSRAALRSLRRRNTGESSGFLDLVGVTADPIEATYLGIEAGLAPVIVFPMSSLRVEKIGLKVDDLETNPYTRSVVEYLSGEHVAYPGSTLQRHFASWQPGTLAAFLGLEVEGSAPLLREEIQAVLLPWERPLTRSELKARREANERTWALRFGPSPTGHGSTSYGPTSDELGSYRFGKHCTLAESMAGDTAGKDRTDPAWWSPERGGYIEVQILAHEDTTVGIVREGKHRSAALAALGAHEIVVALPRDYPLVRRSDVGSWPGVCAGVFTTEQALLVFDRFVAGAPPWKCTDTPMSLSTEQGPT